MRIVQLITRMNEPGGAQIHVKELSVSLSKMGHHVSLLSGSESTFFPELLNQGIPYQRINHLFREINPFKDILAVIELRRALKKLNPDLLALHSSKAGLIGRIAGWSLGIPTVFTAHGWAFTEGVSKKKRTVYSFLEKIAGKLSDRIITVSSYDLNLAITKKVVPKNKMMLIHNGVPDVLEHSLALPESHPPKMVMVARFAEPKDQIALVNGLDKIKALDWTLFFVGDGPLKEETEKRVEELNFSDRIYFLGNRKDVPDILSASQIFILLSKFEGFPLSVLEAMRCGLPVIASDVGGVGEAVVHEQTGYLVAKGDEEDLINKLSVLIENPELRSRMGKAGRERFLKHFTIDRMVHETLEVYKEAIYVKTRLGKNKIRRGERPV